MRERVPCSEDLVLSYPIPPPDVVLFLASSELKIDFGDIGKALAERRRLESDSERVEGHGGQTRPRLRVHLYGLAASWTEAHVDRTEGLCARTAALCSASASGVLNQTQRTGTLYSLPFRSQLARVSGSGFVLSITTEWPF